MTIIVRREFMLRDNILKANKEEINEITFFLKEKLQEYYVDKHKIRFEDDNLKNELFYMIIDENSDINNILTITEIAEQWGKDTSNLRRKARSVLNDSKYNTGIRKSGTTFLIKKSMCNELFGEVKKNV
jgi:hypothetical protein